MFSNFVKGSGCSSFWLGVQFSGFGFDVVLFGYEAQLGTKQMVFNPFLSGYSKIL